MPAAESLVSFIFRVTRFVFSESLLFLRLLRFLHRRVFLLPLLSACCCRVTFVGAVVKEAGVWKRSRLPNSNGWQRMFFRWFWQTTPERRRQRWRYLRGLSSKDKTIDGQEDRQTYRQTAACRRWIFAHKSQPDGRTDGDIVIIIIMNIISVVQVCCCRIAVVFAL